MKLQTLDGICRAQPDPFMCQTKDGWAMYVTGVDGVKAYRCDSPFGQWEYVGIIFQIEGYHEYWAPCMYYEDGWYYLYCSCRKVTDSESLERLHVAKARVPFGPFENPKQLYPYFSIDPHVVRTEEGLFLWYCMDRTDTDRVGTRIFVEHLLNPETPAGNAVQAVAPSFDEEIYMRNRFAPGQHWYTIEGPFWLQVGEWQYVMYSGACYQNDTYHIGYASAKTEEANLAKVSYNKYSDHGRFAPLMTKNKVEEGVGHHSVVVWEGQYYAIYHARDVQPDCFLLGDQRTARICKLHFEKGVITAERMV